MNKLLYTFLFFALIGKALAQHPAEEFLSKYCLECHDSDVQKGNRSFEELFFPIESQSGLIETQEIIDQLNLGEMPPKKAQQPDDAETAAIIKSLTEEVAKGHLKFKGDSGQTVLRRLNEREYLNTLEDLFGRRVDTLAPTDSFPNDQTHEHIDTIGDTLVTSSFLLSNYFDAAHKVVEAALNPIDKPEVKQWHFDKNFTQGQELRYSHKHAFNYRYLCVYEVPNTTNHEGGYGGLEEFPEGVHEAGFYEVKVLAHSKNRDTHYDPSIFKMDLREHFRLGIVPGDARVGDLHHPQPIEPQLAEVTVKDGDPKWYTMKVWLEKGQQPRFIFPNGMANCRNAFSKIASKYKKEWPKGDEYLKKAGIVQARRVVLQHGKMPHIRIHEVKIKGPLNPTWPPKYQQQIFGEGDFSEAHRLDVIQRFARRAYRRKPDKNQIDSLLRVIETRIAAGHTPRQATIDAIKAALCSPAFMYFLEPGAKQAHRLAADDLASRLAYFLTATMPDSTLSSLAESGDILSEATLDSEIERLLGSKKSIGFYAGFTDSWLNLRSLGGMPPERSASGEYFYDDLETAMKQEVQYFLRHLVESNQPITDFLDSDYTFVNHPLAKLYKEPFNFPTSERYQFKKIALKNANRGGLPGMAAVLTVSANGIETSPVTRGVYLLENILGTPTPPPPDEVPAIETDTRGTSTIRDELEKHRQAKTCAECHRRIDPMGFALEKFDPIGRWRTSYPPAREGKKGQPIDASGTFPDGTPFNNMKQFRAHLLTKSDLFARNLTETLLSYATGRDIGPLDRPEVDKIITVAKEDDFGMRTLLKAVIQSETFRSR